MVGGGTRDRKEEETINLFVHLSAVCKQDLAFRYDVLVCLFLDAFIFSLHNAFLSHPIIVLGEAFVSCSNLLLRTFGQVHTGR